MFLDSGRPLDTRERYDILVFDPVATLVTRGLQTEIKRSADRAYSTDDPLKLLQSELERFPATTPSDVGLPFAGGAVGYFSYDLGRRFETLPSTAIDVEQLPDMAVGIYDRAIVVDHAAHRSFYIGPDGTMPILSTSPRARPELRALDRVQTNLDRADYFAAFERVIDYIRAGDCYQVNLARRFALPVAGDPWVGYRCLRSISPAPCGAYLNTPEVQILSVSPERFLQVRGDGVETRPIKGTRPRAANADMDRRLAQELLTSAKDRAENVMIVDLLRNDLGKVCAPGSVNVQALCALESFSNVHHLVSTITGRIPPQRHALDVMRACFPGGSITGAPKIRAMQIIEELERERRGVYCGAIGYVGFDGSMDMNIAIRTMLHANGHVRFWAGGGIVADSVAEAEYQEAATKASAMLKLLGIDAI